MAHSKGMIFESAGTNGNRNLRVYRLILPLSIAAIAGLAGCSKHLATSASAPSLMSNTATTPATPMQQISNPQQVAAQVQAVTAPLNQTPQYALTSEDIALMQSQGVLATGDQATLQAVVATQ